MDHSDKGKRKKRGELITRLAVILERKILIDKYKKRVESTLLRQKHRLKKYGL